MENQEKQEKKEYQELGYLRNEINQLHQFNSEYTNKTIQTVLLIWGGAIVFIGNSVFKLSVTCFENVFPYFIMAVVFFISNMVLYFTARRYYDTSDGICRLVSYLAVFYETRPSEKFKVGDFCWELALFECCTSKDEPIKNRYKHNIEYAALTLISIILMVIFLTLLVINIFAVSELARIACIIVSLIYLICLGFSVCWLRKLPQYTYAKDDYKMKTKHLKIFIDYALETKRYRKEELKERLGPIWGLVMDQA